MAHDACPKKVDTWLSSLQNVVLYHLGEDSDAEV